jgi:hypothetical protein
MELMECKRFRVVDEPGMNAARTYAMEIIGDGYEVVIRAQAEGVANIKSRSNEGNYNRIAKLLSSRGDTLIKER